MIVKTLSYFIQHSDLFFYLVEMVFFLIKHIENRKIIFLKIEASVGRNIIYVLILWIRIVYW